MIFIRTIEKIITHINHAQNVKILNVYANRTIALSTTAISYCVLGKRDPFQFTPHSKPVFMDHQIGFIYTYIKEKIEKYTQKRIYSM